MFPDVKITLQIICLLILVLLSAFFSGAETALFSLSRARLFAFEQDKSPIRRQIAALMKKYNRTLVTLILGNMFVNTGISMINNELLSYLKYNQALTLALSIFISVVILLLFGEVTPKMIALLNNEKFSEFAAPLVSIFIFIMNPAISAIEKICSAILDLLGRKKQMALSQEEYQTYVAMAESVGAFDSRETALLEKIFALRVKKISQIATPRTEVECVRMNATPEELEKQIRSSCKLFYPVIKNDIDDSENILSARAFFELDKTQRINWHASTCIMKARFLPENTTAIKALSELKQSKTPVALLCDEYGGIAGMIHLKDIYEEIVGATGEEYEHPSWEMHKFFAGVWHTSGNLLVTDISETSGWEPPPDCPNTINGIFIEKLGRVPQEGDMVLLNHARFTAIRIANNKVVEAEFRYPIEATLVEESEEKQP